MDTIRVLRLIEYVGPRNVIEKQLDKSITGRKDVHLPDGDFTIRVVTLGEVAEVLNSADEEEK